jgi:Sec7-like guanine-nucleotide exchange factor
MFNTARPNSRAYIFFKGEKPRFEQGLVINNPIVKPKYNIPVNFTQKQETLTDITIKTDSGTYNFTGIPSELEVADTFCNGEAAVVSLSRDAFSAEVLSIMQRSEDVLKSKPYHESMIETCKQTLEQVNPEYADQKQRDERLDSLEKKVDVLTDKLGLLVDELTSNK